MIEKRIDPCMSEVFPWDGDPAAHVKMLRNEHKPGNMAVLVQAPRPGSGPWDVLDAGRLK
jgi:crotonyl-CoA carboxylase/reductase